MECHFLGNGSFEPPSKPFDVGRCLVHVFIREFTTSISLNLASSDNLNTNLGLA
jgi:hypothetical protein